MFISAGPLSKYRWQEGKHEHTFFIIVLLGLVYFATAKLGFTLAFTQTQVTSIWIPAGISLAALLLFGYRVWPGVFLGAYVANVTANEPVLAAISIATTNTLAGLIGVYLLREKLDFHNNLDRLRDVLNFILFGAFSAAIISSVFGSLTLYGFGLLPAVQFIDVWAIWWMGDVMGILIAAPLLLLWFAEETFDVLRKKWFELSVFAVLLLLVGSYVFLNPEIVNVSPSAYLIFPFIVWASIRLGQAANVSAIFMISFLAVYGTYNNTGPFALSGGVEENLMSLLIFLFVFATTGLILASIVSERKRIQDKIEHQSFYDYLTDLANRSFFTEQIQGYMEKQNPGLGQALLVIDLDRFKTINDSLGYKSGDRLIQDVCLRLRAQAGREYLLARLGGDEFGLYMPKIKDQDEVEIMAGKIFDMFRTPFYLDGDQVYVSVSVGISLYPHDGQNALMLLRNAYAALDHTQKAGGNNYEYYDSSLNATSYGQLTMESSLRRAVNSGEFEIYYQPEVDLRTGQIVRAEALLRWHRPGVGTVAAGEFIKLAETTGVIEKMEAQTIAHAVEQAALWQRQNYHIGVAVNVSARQFRDEKIVLYIDKLLKKYKLPAKYLELEVTERILLENSDIVRKILRQLKSMGVVISIDDFNTGYSSLSYIKQFPFDTLKIDRTFVAGIPDNINDCEIAKSIIHLAHNLKKDVTAEGIETVKQISFLSKEGCDRVQGFLFSPALPAGKFLEFCKTKAQTLKSLIGAGA